MYKALLMPSYNLIPPPTFPASHASLMEFSEALAFALPYKSNAIRQRRVACPAQGALDLLKTHVSKLSQRGTPLLTIFL